MQNKELTTKTARELKRIIIDINYSEAQIYKKATINFKNELKEIIKRNKKSPVLVVIEIEDLIQEIESVETSSDFVSDF